MNTGFAFGEHIKTEKISGRGGSVFGRKKRDYEDRPRKPNSRGYLLPVVLLLAALALVFKLFYLQIIKGGDYRALADSNRIRTQIIHAPRGVIFDRNGIPLVQNVPGFRQIVTPVSGSTPAKTVVLSQDQAMPLLAKNDKNLEVDSLREYSLKDVMGHVLGYTGQISKEELESPELSGYQNSSWIGKSGIERQYEGMLRGTDGKQLIEVDSVGRRVRSLGQTDPVPGQDVTLTIDAKIQKAAYAGASNVKKGAVIVSKPDGEILALISKPSYDPNLFTLDKNYQVASESAYKKVNDILTDSENQPLLNRTISGTYPPGSTFKLVTAAAGLQNKIIDENYNVQDTGEIRIGEFSFANWYFLEFGRKEQGDINVVRAIARSNDIFFYKLAEKVHVDNLSAMAEKFGIGSKLGIDLSGEKKGLVPSEKWKEDTLKEQWYLGDTYHYGIGQGYLLTTPLQVNSWTVAVANHGTLPTPHLLKSHNPKPLNTNFLNDKTTSLIRQGMIDSCSTGGVAWPLFDFKVANSKLRIDGRNFTDAGTSDSAKMTHVAVACKTGTAQHGGETTLPHAWITLFAPAYNPEIVVTVLNESSGEGSNEAAPVAKKILEEYFGGK